MRETKDLPRVEPDEARSMIMRWAVAAVDINRYWDQNAPNVMRFEDLDAEQTAALERVGEQANIPEELFSWLIRCEEAWRKKRARANRRSAARPGTLRNPTTY